MKQQDLPPEEVKVKVSTCPKCKGWVKASVEHRMSGHDKRAFGKEVVEHDLSVETIPLLEWRESDLDMCGCN